MKNRVVKNSNINITKKDPDMKYSAERNALKMRIKMNEQTVGIAFAHKETQYYKLTKTEVTKL